jgi:hypothetical protein
MYGFIYAAYFLDYKRFRGCLVGKIFGETLL